MLSYKVSMHLFMISFSIRYTDTLSRYHFCPQDQILCDNDESVQLYRSSVPLLSNTNDNVDADRISSGHVCVYEVEIEDNLSGDELLEITLEHVKNAKVGILFNQTTNENKTIDSGFFNRDNCSMEVNCTKNMRGKHVYYLSGVSKLFLTIVSTARNDTARDS